MTAWIRRLFQTTREDDAKLFQPGAVIAISLLAAVSFVGLMLPLHRFESSASRTVLIVYHAPVGMAFTAFALDRLKYRRAIPIRQALIEIPVLALALSRALLPVPFISGHALFLSYALVTEQLAPARAVAAVVLFEVILLKLFVFQDGTLPGGIALGLAAGMLANYFIKERG